MYIDHHFMHGVGVQGGCYEVAMPYIYSIEEPVPPPGGQRCPILRASGGGRFATSIRYLSPHLCSGGVVGWRCAEPCSLVEIPTVSGTVTRWVSRPYSVWLWEKQGWLCLAVYPCCCGVWFVWFLVFLCVGQTSVLPTNSVG